MLKLIRVAVTGGIASGKTTVTSFFQKFGAYVVSADQIVHQLLSSNTSLVKQVISLLGEQILRDGSIDRKKMADIVFENPKLLQKLEHLLHPLVAQEIKASWNYASSLNKYKLFVAEVPLLFEAGLENEFDASIAVVSPEDDCRKRYRGGIDDYNRRAISQFTERQKALNATFIIENTGSLEELEAKVASLYTLLSKGENLDV